MRRLKVYGVSSGTTRTIVAAHTKKDAANALGLSLYAFKQLAAETAKDTEIALALSCPGSPFRRPLTVHGEWQAV